MAEVVDAKVITNGAKEPTTDEPTRSNVLNEGIANESDLIPESMRRRGITQILRGFYNMDSYGGTISIIEERPKGGRGTRPYFHDYDDKGMRTLTEFDGIDHKGFLLLPTENTSSHLLLIALIEQLCSFLEEDADKKKMLFNLICRHLSQLKVISPSLYMDEFSPLRRKYGRNFSNLIETFKGLLDNKDKMLIPITSIWDSRFLSASSVQSFSCSDRYEWESRYFEEFEEIEKIGQGGFGTIYKVQNKLDKSLYAIKKIPIRTTSQEAGLKILKEVKVFASLKHPNVVRYNSAWLECHSEAKYNNPSSNHFLTENCSDNIDQMPKQYSESLSDSNVVFTSTPEASAFDNVHNSYSKEQVVHYSPIHETNELNTEPNKIANEVVDPNKVLSESSSSECLGQQRKGSFSKSESCLITAASEVRDLSIAQLRQFRRCSSCGNDRNCHHKQSTDEQDYHKFLLRDNEIFLYIQMELCSKTLKDWLNERNNLARNIPDCFSLVSKTENLKIFKQILEGVQYIHSKNIMHRDLTPKNIFFDVESERVMIGDFGLARENMYIGSLKDTLSLININYWNNPHSSGVGTSIYASPEQKSGRVYDTMTDIYSLGIILFEMFHPFVTEMERAKVSSNVHSGIIPEAFKKRWPIEGKLIQRLTSYQVVDRPTAIEILCSDLFLSKDQRIRHLEQLLKEKDAEIERLLKLLAIKSAQI